MTKLFFAAPDNFFSTACASHPEIGGVGHAAEKETAQGNDKQFVHGRPLKRSEWSRSSVKREQPRGNRPLLLAIPRLSPSRRLRREHHSQVRRGLTTIPVQLSTITDV